ncbi:MAG: response regulator [Thalassobaculum sp.]|uniref:response regulator n=1 Tax=Thalassobaculum sp. TaxID=2022740 RepID=UPI0032ED41D7
MTDALHVLIVDDEPRIRTMLRRYLAEEGLKVSEAGDGSALRAVLQQEQIDIVLLDLVMPGEDGLSLARDIRRQSDVPIIMVTGKGDLIDRVVGLEAGADDYIAKPFHLREVLARIRTVSRRARVRPAETPVAPDAQAPKGETLEFEGWILDLPRRELRAPDGSTVPLTTAEFELLRAFLQHPNRVLSREQLMDLAKGREWAAYDRTVDTQVMRLRKKVEADHANPTLIKTVRGAGYLFAAQVRPV